MIVDYGQMVLVGAGVIVGTAAAMIYRFSTRGRKYQHGKR